jgi:hypothetical protein
MQALKGMAAVTDKDALSSAVQTPTIDPKLYKQISEEVSNIICRGIYTNKKEGTNMSENINKIITQKIIDILNKDEISEKIQDIIFGNDDEKHPKGLRKYLQDLIRVCDGGNKDEIYAFSGRVLQTLFDKNENTIDGLLESESIKNILYNGTYTDENIADKMKKEILNQLKGSLKISGGGETIQIGGQDPSGNGNPVSGQPDFLGNLVNFFNFSKPTDTIQGKVSVNPSNTPVPDSEEVKKAKEEAEKNVCMKKYGEKQESVELKEVSTPPSSMVIDFLKTSNDIQSHIVSEVKSSINDEKIEYIVNTALEKIIKSILNNITATVSNVVISKYTDVVINNKTMKLQLLYSILSYKQENNVDEFGNMRDNTLYIAKELFMKALTKKRSQEGKSQTLVEILNTSLTDEIAKRGGDFIGRSVATINSIANVQISGGSENREKERKKRNRKTKKRRNGKMKNFSLKH